jgi:hypothetical protein
VIVPFAVIVGGPDLTTDRSAEAVTVVVTLEELLAELGSGVLAATVAVFVTLAAWFGAVTTTVIAGAVAPVASAGRVQVTTPATLPQLQPVPPADTKVVPEGTGSVTVRVAASLGPALATVSV